MYFAINVISSMTCEVLPKLTATCVTFALTDLFCFGKLAWLTLCNEASQNRNKLFFIQLG